MNKELEILLNEYKTIQEFRERSIKNIEETTRTYLLFIGFSVTAASYIFENKNNIVYFSLILFVCLCVGIRIYKMNIGTHITYIKYTRLLNEIRSKFVSVAFFL